MDKLFTLMKGNFFREKLRSYHVESYFFRVEFQQRGAPHLHSLLWMKNEDGDDAPSFWYSPKDNEVMEPDEDSKIKMDEIANFAKFLLHTSSDEMTCKEHANQVSFSKDCENCRHLQEKVQKYQLHRHSFTCAKKRKTITIHEKEGHGRFDGFKKGAKLSNIPVCRFGFPKFPSDETMIVSGLSKDTDEKIIMRYKADLKKIIKFLIRKTYSDKGINEMNALQHMSFYEILFEMGMFDKNVKIENNENRIIAKARYINAISSGVKENATIILKREVKDIFMNGFNKDIMRLHQANHDLQLCLNPYAVTQYMTNYITKTEAGSSRLMKTIDEETNSLSQMDKIKALASVLDKSREVSCQEATYRLLGLPMTKSSVIVKYVSTVHPDFRDGLLKSNLDELNEDCLLYTSPSPRDS